MLNYGCVHDDEAKEHSTSSTSTDKNAPLLNKLQTAFKVNKASSIVQAAEMGALCVVLY